MADRPLATDGPLATDAPLATGGALAADGLEAPAARSGTGGPSTTMMVDMLSEDQPPARAAADLAGRPVEEVGGIMDPAVARRLIAGWHVAFWAMMALAGAQVLLSQNLNGNGRIVAGAVVLALCVSYQVTMWRAGRCPEGLWKGLAEGGWSYLYLSVAVIGSGISCALDTSLTLLLFIVYPQAWMMTRSRRAGTTVTVLLTLSVLIGFLAKYGWSVRVLREVGPQLVVSLLFSVLLGLWIWRVIDQSIERAELIARLEATRSELARSHHHQGVMAERERVAREIHDTLAQGFTSIVMLAQAAAAGLPGHPDRVGRQLSSIEDVARENLAEARALVAAFSPVALDGSTLIDAVRRLAERFGRETGIAVDLEIGPELSGLSRAQEVVVLRTAQEALTNVRRHARAQRVTVRLIRDELDARVEIRDDGVGFGPEARLDSAGVGFGLAGIRGRVADVGGDLDVASSPGEGTRVTVRVPIGTTGGSDPAGSAGTVGSADTAGMAGTAGSAGTAGPAGTAGWEPSEEPESVSEEEAAR